MAGELIGSYSPSEVSLTVSGINMSGFFDGTFITCAKEDNELYKRHVGAYGEVSRTKNNNISGTITFTLKKTSPSNKQLDIFKLLPASFPVMVKNNSDSKHMAVSTSAWIGTDPDIEYGDEESGVEWVIHCADLIMSHLP